MKPRNQKLFSFSRGRRKNADVAQTLSDTAEVMWLRDLLPTPIPNARIATYSYESDWRRADVKTSLRQCGEQFLNVLHQNRSSEEVSKTSRDNPYSSLLKISIGTSTTFGIYRTQPWGFGHQTGWCYLGAEITLPVLSSP